MKPTIFSKALNLIRFYGNVLVLHVATSIRNKQSDIVYAEGRFNKIGYFFPYGSRWEVDRRQLYNLRNGFHKHLLDKYTHNCASLMPTDIVIDCGAFVGGFTVAAHQFGVKHIFSFEPSSGNFKCLKLNVDNFNIENITLLKMALGNNTGQVELNLSESACDNSILEPDEKSTGEKETVDITTLAHVIEEYKLDHNDLFIKVEAEGFEPEIIKGLGNFRPRVITVDVTPERNGESPRQEIREILSKYGYQCFYDTSRCLFAVK